MISAQIQLTDQDARSTASSRGSARLGQLASTNDGRVFAYQRAGGVALSAGKLVTASAIAANHVGRTAVATAAGSTSVTFTLGATAATADQYAEGYLDVNVGPSQGSYKIVGNTAAASSGSITVYLAEPLTAALTTASRLSLYPNPFADTIISASAVALQAVGVPNVDHAIAAYGWAQVGGYCAVLSDGIIGKASGAIISDAVNGAVEVEVAGTVTQRVGFAVEATVDTQYQLINLTLR